MAADNQMDPAELAGLVEPVARGEVDYAKANRLATGEAWSMIPRARYLGNAMLSLLTKIASGYWHVADSQAGYTAISHDALARLALDRLYPRYGFPNDVLVHLNVAPAPSATTRRGRSTASASSSGIRLRKVVPTICALLFRRFWWRLGRATSCATSTRSCSSTSSASCSRRSACCSGSRDRPAHGRAPDPDRHRRPRRAARHLGLPVALFAMWFDMEANKDLR